MVNFFVVKLFLKADRGILKQHPLFLTPLNPLKKHFKKLSLLLCKLFYICFKRPLSIFIINMRINPNPKFVDF